jgi:cyanate lyase
VNYGNVDVSPKERETIMCDKCDNKLDELEMDDRDIAQFAIIGVGTLIEQYCQEGYCDPMMYRVLELMSILAKKLNSEDVVNFIETTKMFAGETVEQVIKDNQIETKNGKWS